MPFLDCARRAAHDRRSADAAWDATERRAVIAGAGAVEGLCHAVPELCTCPDDAHDAEGVALAASLHAVLARMLDRGDFQDHGEGKEVLWGFLAACHTE